MKRICKYCGAESPDTAKFCCECGRELFADGVSPEPPARYVREVRSPESQSPVYTDFAGAIGLYFRNYVNFSGRSTRSEYWYASLFTFGIRLMLLGLEKMTGVELIDYWIFATILPDIAIACRRLHDIDRSGGVYLLMFVPAILMILFYLSGSVEGMLIALVFAVMYFALLIYNVVLFCQPSQPEANRYGRAPY